MKELIEILREGYGFENCDLEKNDDSTDGNVYIAKLLKKKYVIKIYDNYSHTIAMVKLHDFLISSNINVPKIISTTDSKKYYRINKNKYCVVYSFLEGEQITNIWKNDSKTLTPLIAKEVRKIHNLTLNNNSFKLKEVPFKINNNIKRCSVLHFDLTKDNIFYNTNFSNDIGFIDFDDAKYGPCVVEISIILSLLFITKSKGLDKTGMYNFLDEYYGDDIELKELEIPYIKNIAVEWVTYILNNNNFDTSTTESFEIKKELMEIKL
ncbi:MAG: hypothetical protein E7158_06230 [Firmicutes bacterium]|nr:hypothetical protein [Bacillota bacterium]